MSALRDGYAIGEMEAPRGLPSNQAFQQPTAEDAATGKALINFLMEDRFFLALLRSTDAKVRASAIDKLNEAHHRAYGGAPIKRADMSVSASK